MDLQNTIAKTQRLHQTDNFVYPLHAKTGFINWCT